TFQVPSNIGMTLQTALEIRERCVPYADYEMCDPDTDHERCDPPDTECERCEPDAEYDRCQENREWRDRNVERDTLLRIILDICGLLDDYDTDYDMSTSP